MHKQRVVAIGITAVAALSARVSQAGECSDLVNKANAELQGGNFQATDQAAQLALAGCKKEGVRSAPAHVVAGVAKLMLKQPDSAIKELKLAESIDPKSPIVQINLCSAYAEAHDVAKTNKHCRPIYNDSSASAKYRGHAAFNMGKAIFWKKDLKGDVVRSRASEEHFQNAVKLIPEHAEIYFYLGQFKYQLDKDAEQAKALFKQGCDGGFMAACAAKGDLASKESAKESVVMCHVRFSLDRVKEEYENTVTRCKNRPALQFAFKEPLCPVSYDRLSGGYLATTELFRKLDDVCKEKPGALDHLKALSLTESTSFDTQNAKEVDGTLQFELLVGHRHQELVLAKDSELIELIKRELRRVFAVTLKTDKELQDEASAKSHGRYADYKAKRKALRDKQDALIDQRDEITKSGSAEIAQIWSGPGDPTLKASLVQTRQKKMDDAVAPLNQQITDLTDQMNKLNEEQSKK